MSRLQYIEILYVRLPYIRSNEMDRFRNCMRVRGTNKTVNQIQHVLVRYHALGQSVQKIGVHACTTYKNDFSFFKLQVINSKQG